MKRGRKKKSNRLKISFAATVGVLTLITLVAYAFSYGVPKYSVPSNLPPYTGLLGRFSPSDALQVTFDNFTAIRAINSSAILNKQLLSLNQPLVQVDFGAVSAQVLVTLVESAPSINGSATAAIVSRGTFANLTQSFAKSTLKPEVDGSFNLYNVTDHANGRTRTGWLTLVPADSAVVFSEGTLGARSLVMRILGVWQGQVPSILTLQNVTRMLYTVDGTRHLALAIQAFSGQVRTSDMGVVAVDVDSGVVHVSNVIRFANATYAESQISQVKAVYRYAGDFSQYEECVKAIETYSLSNLREAVGLAGE